MVSRSDVSSNIISHSVSTLISVSPKFDHRLLILTAHWRRENPNPWMWCKDFNYFIFALVFGRGPGQQTIDPKKLAEVKAITNNSDYWQARVIRAEEKAKRRAEEYRKEQEEYLRELEEIGDVTEDLVENEIGFGIDPIRAYLFPIQQYLAVACNWVRVVKNILTWEESYISFLISTTCFVLSFAVFFVPWSFCIKWTLRIITWCILGPWMKLADIFYFSKQGNSDDEKERKAKMKLEREKKLKQHRQETQLKREKAGKLRDFKQYMFGEHICRVNILKKDRYYDLPLDSSSAIPHATMRKSLGTLCIEEAGCGLTRIEGQQLEGELIPKVSDDQLNNDMMPCVLIYSCDYIIPGSTLLQICVVPANKVRAGQVTTRTELLKSGSPGKIYSGKDDSAIIAAIKVGSILVGAGAITLYAIPLLSYIVRLVIPN